MHHIDEHILELYVLNAKEVEERRDEIAMHLRECHGCRMLVDEMTEFHAELAEETEKEDAIPSTERALVRRHQDITPYADQFGAPVRYLPNTPMQKARYLIRRHPIAVGK